MKRNIKIIASCLAVLCLLGWVLSSLSGITERKESQQKYQDFFNQEADFDVLFLGNSRTMNAILPMELWNDYGIVSYNLGGHGSFLPTCYWILQNALDYTTPKVVVIDCSSVSSQHLMPSIQYTHQSFDAFPFSLTKVRAVWDLVGDSEEGAGDAFSRRMELLWSFSTYHNRWNELEKADFQLEGNVEKGAESRISVSTPAETIEVSRDVKFEGDSAGKEYLKKMIENCQSRGIEVLLTFLPFPASEGYWKEANCVYDIAEAYGVEYINYLELDVVNFNTDCYDPDSHLNPSGARKVTDHLGKCLQSEYAVPDQRDNPAYEHWYHDYEEYYDYKLEQMWECENGYEYLMLLADDDFSFILEVNNLALDRDERYLQLMWNLGADPDRLTEEITYIVADRTYGTVEYIGRSRLEAGAVSTELGELRLETDGTAAIIYLNGEECAAISQGSQYRYDMRLAMYSLDGKQIKKLQFDVN